MQKSNCLLKTWLTKTPVSCNNGEVILLILVYISKRKDLPSVSNVLWVFHSHFSWVMSLKCCAIISNVQWYPVWLYKTQVLSVALLLKHRVFLLKKSEWTLKNKQSLLSGHISCAILNGNKFCHSNSVTFDSEKSERNPNDEVEWNHNYWNKQIWVVKKPPWTHGLWKLTKMPTFIPFLWYFYVKESTYWGSSGCPSSWKEEGQINAMSFSEWRRFCVNLLRRNALLQLWIYSPNKKFQYNTRAKIVYIFRAFDPQSIFGGHNAPQDTKWFVNSAKLSLHFTCIWFLKVGISATAT